MTPRYAAKLADIAASDIQDMASVSPAFQGLLLALQAESDGIYFFGGAPRAWHFREQVRDLDIAVDIGGRLKLARIIGPYIVDTNVLGGYRLSVPDLRTPIDIWPLADTWVKQRGGAGNIYKGSPQVLVDTASYNIDAVAVELNGKVYDGGFQEALDSGTLHFNMEMHKFPVFHCVRGFHLAKKYNLRLGADVTKYASKVFEYGVPWLTVQRIQENKFGSVTVSQQDMLAMMTDLKFI